MIDLCRCISTYDFQAIRRCDWLNFQQDSFCQSFQLSNLNRDLTPTDINMICEIDIERNFDSQLSMSC